MFGKSLVAMAVLTVGLSGCIYAPPLESYNPENGGAPLGAAKEWKLANVRVDVPDDMPVATDPTVRVPDPGSLNWWGDPPGDRRAQVEEFMTEAARQGAARALTGDRPVDVDILLKRFHALTPKALATDIQLGVHSIQFDITVEDAATHEVLAEQRDVHADMRAKSGPQAVRDEENGVGMKPQITAHFAHVIHQWLAN